MLTIEEIRAMTPEERDAESRRLMKKILIRKIIVPIAITAAVHVVVNYAVKRMDDTTED